MTISDYAENAILDAIFNQGTVNVAALYASLHTGDPGETGTNEVSTGGYARVDVSAKFPASSSGVVTSNADTEFSDMPAVTVYAVGFWDDPSAGNHWWNGWLTGPSVVRGVFSCEADDDLFTAKGHGLTTNDEVVFSAEAVGTTLPTGVSAGTIYHVIASGLTTDAFRVSATEGGSTINVTADGNGTFLKVVPKTVGAGDSFRLASGTLIVSLF